MPNNTLPRYDCKTCGGDIERDPETWEWYHSRIEDFSHTPEPAATYHGIVKAVCLNCGKVTTDVTTLEIMNDAPPGPECLDCGVHDIMWTLRNGTRRVTTTDDNDDDHSYILTQER